MKDTANLREKMLGIWDKFESGKISAQEARTHVGLARTVLESLKVEIAAAHLNVANVPPVSLSAKPIRMIQGRRAA